MGRARAGDLIFHSLCGPVERKNPLTWAAQQILYIFQGRIRSSEAAMGVGGTQRPVGGGNELKKTGARSAQVRTGEHGRARLAKTH
jgi:hypothetical protein